jgi:hypothetical protein
MKPQWLVMSPGLVGGGPVEAAGDRKCLLIQELPQQAYENFGTPGILFLVNQFAQHSATL